jgi:hypothetical protein
MRNTLLAAVTMFLVPSCAFCADNEPSTMIHVIAQMSGTDIPAGAFAGKPKTMWRASNSYCRIETG